MYWYQSVDIKVDTPDPMTGFQTPTAAINYIDFEGLTHRNPFRGVTSRVFLQVHNRGVSAATGVSVRPFWANAGGGLPDLPADFWMAFPGADPTDTSVWHPVGAAQTIPSIRPGEPEIVSWEWPVPMNAPDHTCMFAAITCMADPVSETGLDVDAIVPSNKHITLKNLHVDGPAGPGTVRGPFFIDFEHSRKERIFDLVIRPERLVTGARIWFLATPYKRAASSANETPGIRIEKSPLGDPPKRPDEQCGEPTSYDPRRAHIVVSTGEPVALRGILTEPGRRFSIALFVDLPAKLPPGEVLRFHVQHYREGRLVGGSAYEIRTGKPLQSNREVSGEQRARSPKRKPGERG